MAQSTKANFELEIQHEGIDISTKALEKVIKSALKEAGYTLSHYQVSAYYIPAKQEVHYHLNSIKTDESLTGHYTLTELIY